MASERSTMKRMFGVTVLGDKGGDRGVVGHGLGMHSDRREQSARQCEPQHAAHQEATPVPIEFRFSTFQPCTFVIGYRLELLSLLTNLVCCSVLALHGCSLAKNSQGTRASEMPLLI